MGSLVLHGAAFLLCLGSSYGYYLPGTYPREFYSGQQLQAEVNSVTSSETELPYNYYSLPFCKPPEGVKKSTSAINPGTILSGARIENSPYNFSMLVDEKTKLACEPDGFYGPLTDREVADLRSKIDQHYRVRLILDNLPVTTNDLEEKPESVRPGFEIGYKSDDGKYYINNHLMFMILVHKTNGQYMRSQKSAAEMEAAAVVESGVRRRELSLTFNPLDLLTGRGRKELSRKVLLEVEAEGEGGPMYMVVGFEVLACSIERQPYGTAKDISCPSGPSDPVPIPQEIYKDGKIVYTYDVFWSFSATTWASRWDAYLRMPGGRVHWFSIMNSLMVVLIMSSIVAMILMRTVRRDLARYEGILGDGGAKDDVEESGWKMVSGDVFRPPSDEIALCVQVGSGVQIVLAGFITLFFAALGFLSPAARGALLTALLVVYMLLAISAGFAAVWLHGALTRSYDGWVGVAIRTAAFFPGITLAVLCFLNVLLWHTGSSGAIPLGAFFSFIAVWFIISTPLCFCGGVLASKQELLVYPTRTNQIPRHIPPPHWASHPWVLFLAAGLLPFGTIFVELYFAMTSVWQGYFYYIFGFCFVVGVLTVLITIEVGLVCTYVQLCAEDYLWWWRSFMRGGSVSFYIGLYSISFLFNTLHSLSGFLSVLLYLSYMGLVLWAIYLAMGTIGFLSSFYLTYSIFSAVKAD